MLGGAGQQHLPLPRIRPCSAPGPVQRGRRRLLAGVAACCRVWPLSTTTGPLAGSAGSACTRNQRDRLSEGTSPGAPWTEVCCKTDGATAAPSPTSSIVAAGSTGAGVVADAGAAWDGGGVVVLGARYIGARLTPSTSTVSSARLNRCAGSFGQTSGSSRSSPLGIDTFRVQPAAVVLCTPHPQVGGVPSSRRATSTSTAHTRAEASSHAQQRSPTA